MLAELRQRSDFSAHGGSPVEIKNGRTVTLDQTRPHRYSSGLEFLPQPSWPGYRLQEGVIDEGFRLTLSPLYNTDGSELEVVVDCRATQIERLAELMVDAPNAVDSRQRVKIEVPQIACWELHERFRWPADQVLIVSRGLTALPGPAGGRGLDRALLGGLLRSAPRSEAIMVLEPTVVARRLSVPADGPASAAAPASSNRY
jgi:hypothetical protein